jgi:hypothetical protein
LKVWSNRVVAADTTESVELRFGPDAFHHWDTATGAWRIAPGDFDLVLASSATAEHARLRVTVTV